MVLEVVGLIARLLVAITFVVAGFTKLANIQQSRKTVLEFGLPQPAAHLLGTLLPFCELVFALLLLPVATLFWGSIGAIALLLAFIVAIAINLSLGRKPDCNCFGQVSSKPIGWPTLVRNFALLACALSVQWDWRVGKPLSIVGWISNLSSLAVLTSVMTALTIAGFLTGTWVAFHLFRQNGRLLLRMDDLEKQLVESCAHLPSAMAPIGQRIGNPAPYFELPRLEDTSKVSLHTLLAEERPIALIFSDPDCSPCTQLLPEVSRWSREHAGVLTIVLISRGSREANRKKISAHAVPHVLLQKDREVAAVYQCNGTPGAILVSADGMIGSFVAMGSQAIAALVAKGAGAATPGNLLTNGKSANNSVQQNPTVEQRIGSPAPSLRLPDLSGKIVDLARLKGREILVLFWNPSCGFCARMLPDLKLWVWQNRAEDAPQLLIVSSGTVEVNVEVGAIVVLDQKFVTGQAFGACGTPAAVLVDVDGNIASEIASGAAAVFALANRQLKIPAK